MLDVVYLCKHFENVMECREMAHKLLKGRVSIREEAVLMEIWDLLRSCNRGTIG